MMNIAEPTLRRASLGDAALLAQIRYESILTLATAAMSSAQADHWARSSDRDDMERKIREWEVWVAELAGAPVAWIAFHVDRLEGLYVHPDHAGRGIGTSLLRLAEDVMRVAGVKTIQGEASWNAEPFYQRQGYEFAGPRPSAGARPIRKRVTGNQSNDE